MILITMLFISFEVLTKTDLVKALKGETFTEGSFNDERFSEEKHIVEIQRNKMGICYFYIYRALSAVVFAFTISLGEFGASSLVVRPEYPTLPIAIARFLSQPGGLNYGQAMAMATILRVVCGVGILLIERLRLPGAGEF